MDIFLALLIPAVAVAFLAWKNLVNPHIKHRDWQEIAAEFDLHCDEADCLVEGELYGVPVKAYVETLSPGQREQQHLTHFRVDLSALDIPPMRLRPERKVLGINLDKLSGSPEVEIDYKVLDDAFLINGSNKDEIRAFLRRTGVPSALMQCLRKTRGEVKFEGGMLRLTLQKISAKERLRDTLDSMARCGAAFKKAAEDPAGPE